VGRGSVVHCKMVHAGNHKENLLQHAMQLIIVAIYAFMVGWFGDKKLPDSGDANRDF